MFARFFWRLLQRRRASSDLVAIGVASVREPIILMGLNSVAAELRGDDWFAIICGDGIRTVLPLDAKGPQSYLLARIESLELALQSAPTLISSGSPPLDGEFILGVPEEGEPGLLHVHCDLCQGYNLELIAAPYQPPPPLLCAASGVSLVEAISISARYRAAYARLCAYRFLYVRARDPLCLGCITRQVRQGSISFDGDCAVWFDTDSSDWQLWQSLDDQSGVSLPLGISNFFIDPAELEDAVFRQLNN